MAQRLLGLVDGQKTPTVPDQPTLPSQPTMSAEPAQLGSIFDLGLGEALGLLRAETELDRIVAVLALLGLDLDQSRRVPVRHRVIGQSESTLQTLI